MFAGDPGRAGPGCGNPGPGDARALESSKSGVQGHFVSWPAPNSEEVRKLPILGWMRTTYSRSSKKTYWMSTVPDPIPGRAEKSMHVLSTRRTWRSSSNVRSYAELMSGLAS